MGRTQQETRVPSKHTWDIARETEADMGQCTRHHSMRPTKTAQVAENCQGLGMK